MPELRLAGCRTRPLLGYLKALGVFRVVARQADPQARARWFDGNFGLSSALDRDTLCDFLLERYAPTPIVSPWNGGSGFFPKDRTEPIETVEGSRDARLTDMRQAIADARRVLASLGVVEKPDRAAKLRVLRACRAAFSEAALEWLDAAVVLTEDVAVYPPLLGSGGNDGRFDFSNNYAAAVAKALALEGSRKTKDVAATWLAAAIDGDPAPLEKMSMAHFRRDASPVNSPLGEMDALGNPWDLVLALEGSLLLAAGAARRYGVSLEGTVVAPFTARSTAAGYGSAVGAEKGRAELWLPLWSAWVTLFELEALAREGRAQVGRRTARTGLDFVRAIGELGVARGISAFERFAVHERAGQSSLAVPAGRVRVHPRPAAAALQSIDGWLDRLLRYGRGGCPAAHASAIRRLEAAAFAFADDASATAACVFLERLGEVETVLAKAGRVADGAGLSPLRGVQATPWLDAADDGTVEFTVATAIASLHDRSSGRPGIRDYLHGTEVDERGYRTYAVENRRVPRLAAPVARLAALHARRHVDAGGSTTSEAHRETGTLPFDAGTPCPLAEARSFAAGQLDDERIVRLALGLSLFEYARVRRPLRTQGAPPPQPVYELLALAWAGIPARPLAPRPGWAARLAAGAVLTVLEDAHLRLTMAGFVPLVTPGDLAVLLPSGQRLAASLLLRLRDEERERLANTLTKRVQNDNATEGVSA